MSGTNSSAPGAGSGGGGPAEVSATGALPDTSGWTKDRAMAEITAIAGGAGKDRDHALVSKHHPQHAEWVSHWTRLHEIAHPPADAGPAAAPVRQTAAPARPSLSSDQAKAEIAAQKAMMAKDPSHPFFDKMNPEHKAVMDRWTMLHEAAYPETNQALDAGATEGGNALSDTETSILVSNHLNLRNVKVDGQELNGEDVIAGRRLATETIAALNLPREDAGHLVLLMNASVRAPVGIEQGRAALEKAVGSQYVEGTLADARKVVAHLDRAGVPATRALELTGAGNNAALIKYLASLARRLK